MVYLLTDNGEYRQLPCPGVVTIGRDPGNTIRAKSQSTSAFHARITIEVIRGTSKINIVVEDLNSTNGTFVGETPLDIEKIRGSCKLKFGDYIRFGFANEFFRILEKIPEDQIPVESEDAELEVTGGLFPPINSSYNSQNSPVDFRSVIEKSNIPPTRKFGTGAGDSRGNTANLPISSFKLPDIRQSGQRNPQSGTQAPFAAGSGRMAPLVSQKTVKGDELSSSDGIELKKDDPKTRNEPGNVKNVTILTSQEEETFNIDPSLKNYEVESQQQHFKASSLEPSFDKLFAFQKYSYGNYSKELMFKYYEQNSLWLKQFYHQLQVTNRNQPFYIKLIENMMQIGAIQDLVPPAVLLLVETDSEETKDKERPLKRKSAIQRRISSIYQMEGNSQEEFAAIAKIFGSLPAEQRDYVCSEFMAENLLIEQQSAAASSLGDQHHPATTFTTISLFGETIVQLYDLYKLCFLGASQPMLEVFSDHQDGAVPQVGEVDILLTQELIAIMKQAMKNISLINQSAIINSLSDADPGSDNEQEEVKNSVSRTGAEGSATEEEDTRPVPLSLPLFPSLYHHLDFISNKIDTLMQFISFYFLDPQQSQSNPQQSLSNQQVFEIVKVYLAIILALFYKVYLVLLEIYVEIGRLYDQHLLNNQQNNQEFSLLQELQRLTLMNFTAEEQAAIANADGGGGRVDGGDNKVDVKTLIGRLRKHEVDLAGKKFSGLYRVMEIFLKYALKGYFRQWRSHTKSHKQYELEIADKEERLITRQKADIFQMWRKLFTKRRLLKKAVSRMLRTLNYNFEKTKLACFRKWKEVIFQMNRLHPMISELKLQILSLQSEVELLQSVGNGVPDSQHLPAPPSLPYSSRSGPHQQQQHLSSTGPSLLAAERALNKELLNTNMTLRDSVKELELKLLEMNGVTPAKRKDLVYHYLLDKENQIITSKQEMKLLQAELEQLRNILYLQQQQQQARNPANNKVPNTNRPVSNAQNSGGGNNTYFRGPGNLLPARPTARDGSLPMGKVEAKFIILNEIQRLKRSLQSQEQDKQQYQSQRLQESDYYTQLSIANQTLCHRMNEFNRSTVALRELLRQKIGFDGMLEIVESMQNMGIDAYPLLGTIPNPGVSGGGAMSGQKIE